MKNKTSKKQPFFASFLEKQVKEPKKVVGGGDGPIITIPEKDSVTKPDQDMAQTQKYPSDGDDDVQYVDL